MIVISYDEVRGPVENICGRKITRIAKENVENWRYVSGVCQKPITWMGMCVCMYV